MTPYRENAYKGENWAQRLAKLSKKGVEDQNIRGVKFWKEHYKDALIGYMDEQARLGRWGITYTRHPLEEYHTEPRLIDYPPEVQSIVEACIRLWFREEGFQVTERGNYTRVTWIEQ